MTEFTATWPWLRSSILQPEVLDLITASAPKPVTTISHVRTAHYAAYKVDLEDQSSWLVRVGVIQPTDSVEPDNNGFLGVSTFSPSGQEREVTISQGYASAGAAVIPIEAYLVDAGFDVTWTSFKTGDEVLFTATQWHKAITSLQAYKPDFVLPTFTNRAKTFARLEAFPATEAANLRAQYDEALERLFSIATQWSVAHGDAHAGNALSVQGELLLFDFDTACWAPSVWDLSHLLTRAGTGLNAGYTRDEVVKLFPFTIEEVEATEALRRIASGVARKHNAEYGV